MLGGIPAQQIALASSIHKLSPWILLSPPVKVSFLVQGTCRPNLRCTYICGNILSSGSYTHTLSSYAAVPVRTRPLHLWLRNLCYMSFLWLALA